MSARRLAGCVMATIGCCLGAEHTASAQCCLNDLFTGCLAGCRKPAYAVAPVAVAPVMAPMPAPPPPVMVPVQQVSYVPETTYRTEYKCVPVTTYKPSCEIDPCTGCPVDCMQPVTQYVQQAVNVPVTQYRAVTTTKYVQMQPGYGAPAAPPMAAGPPAASPFAAVQTTPQAWGAAGADVSRQPLPGVAPPSLPAAPVQPATTYQYQPAAPPAFGGQPAPQIITPQSGNYAPTQGSAAAPLQATPPPALAPAPSLKPIPELPKTAPTGGEAAAAATGTGGTDNGTTGQPASDAEGPARMPVLPGPGPSAATGAFPRLLEPTGHTTSWGPSDGGSARVQYPTAALPAWRQR